MFQGIGLKIFNSFHTGEPVFVLFYIEIHYFLNNSKKLAMSLIYNVYTNTEPILPLDLLHVFPFFKLNRPQVTRRNVVCDKAE